MGWDFDREEPRNFLLKRIVSKVKIGTDEYEKPDPALLKQALTDLEQLVERQVARLRIKQNSEAWIRFGSPNAVSDEVEIHYQDLHLLAEELREYGRDIQVLSPQELAREIRRGFEQVASDHA
jgi:proteasome accessory factor B